MTGAPGDPSFADALMQIVRVKHRRDNTVQRYPEFEELKGLTFSSVLAPQRERVLFHIDENRSFVLEHHQDCCEHVELKQIDGDVDDLIHSPILLAEETSREGTYDEGESSTWTFYKLATAKGHVTFTFFGQSNGYYSEKATLTEYVYAPPSDD